jgi:uncharacterized protein (TIGR02001 family)
VVAIAGLSAAPDRAMAQVAASLSVSSDVRLRGLSLNGGGPVATANLVYDHASGAYGGVSVTAGDTSRFGVQFLNLTSHVGYAGRLSRTLAVDVGVIDTRVNSNVYLPSSGRYTEAYVGLGTESVSARLFYTPSFFIKGLDAAYLDLNGNIRPLRWLRAFGHAGLLVPLGDYGEAVLPRARYDLRFGVVAELGRGELQLAWVHSGAGAAFLAPRRQTADALVVGASWFF